MKRVIRRLEKSTINKFFNTRVMRKELPLEFLKISSLAPLVYEKKGSLSVSINVYSKGEYINATLFNKNGVLCYNELSPDFDSIKKEIQKL